MSTLTFKKITIFTLHIIYAFSILVTLCGLPIIMLLAFYHYYHATPALYSALFIVFFCLYKATSLSVEFAQEK